MMGAGPILLSVLIPTLLSRADSLKALTGKLRQQITDNGLDREVEILELADSGELPTGTKRNMLMARASGAFLVCVDDDDDVHERYIPLIVEVLRTHPDIDCIGIKGRITFAGRSPRIFIYSNRYREYSSRRGVYERPPHHLNPIRASIARRFPFEPVRKCEDSDWAMRLSKAGALRNEVFLDEILYHYRCRRECWYQNLLDRTEFFRHPLGLYWFNRFRLKRWVQSLIARPEKRPGRQR